VPGLSISSGAGLAIVVNPSAGSSDSDDLIDVLRSEFPDAALISVGDDLPLQRALEESEASAVLAIVGGDGSINAAAEHALATGRPLAVLPGGTLNHFARDLGIDEAADTISALHGGHLVAVDVGLIDGKPFLNTASFGTYAAFVDAREKLEGRLGKWAAACIAAAQVLWRAEPLRVDLDGQRRQIWMIFIGNCEYQPPGFAPSRRDRLDDGLFDVRYLDGTPRGSRTRFVLALITGQLSRAKVYQHTLVRALEVHSLDGPLRLARDGETFDGSIDVRVTKHPDRLAIYAPSR
jgi:undecaprenyl-diphosphatase